MESIKKEKVSNEVAKSITDYVYNKYESLKGKDLDITENDSCYMVKKHEHGGPLILGKDVI
jgi:hypothetical protein